MCSTTRLALRLVLVIASLACSRKPDLSPVPDPRPGFGLCRLVGGKLMVSVKNGGGSTAPASTTRVAFSPGGSFDLPTPSIPVGGTVDLPPLEIPGSCFDPDCGFSITVDAKGEVDEANERNNSGSGSCIG